MKVPEGIGCRVAVEVFLPNVSPAAMADIFRGACYLQADLSEAAQEFSLEF